MTEDITVTVSALMAGRISGPEAAASLQAIHRREVAAELRRAAHDFSRQWPVYGDDWLLKRADNIDPTTKETNNDAR